DVHRLIPPWIHQANEIRPAIGASLQRLGADSKGRSLVTISLRSSIDLLASLSGSATRRKPTPKQVTNRGKRRPSPAPYDNFLTFTARSLLLGGQRRHESAVVNTRIRLPSDLRHV